MGPFILAWLVGEAIITWRSIALYKAPPLPSAILGTSGLFIMLAILAEWAPPLATMLAWGFDLAAFLTVAGQKPKYACGQTTSNGGSNKSAKPPAKPSFTDRFNPGKG